VRKWTAWLRCTLPLVAIVAGLSLLAGCGRALAPSAPSHGATPEAREPSVPDLVRLEPMFGGLVFARPVDVGPYPDGQLYVALQEGPVLVGAPDGELDLLLDLSAAIGDEHGGEQGLLSVALDPAFDANGHLYAYYAPGHEPVTRLSRFTVVDGVAGLDSEHVVLEIEQPFTNHNGGAVVFGQDGMLYLSVGDGGGPSDPAVNRRGQDRATLFGTVVRLDVRESSPDEPYRIPADNPFLDEPDTLSEIWAYGFRNPWRMAVDRLTGALWLGDVGEDRFEEVNLVTPGGNYGWNDLEGGACFPEGAGCVVSPDFLPPVMTYTHAEGCSISGGVVYRGSNPALAGRFVYGDFCNGSIWGLDVESLDHVRLAHVGRPVISIGEDAEGEAYVLAFDSPVLRLTALD
jgi:glucose/arabinose dehydrogenase